MEIEERRVKFHLCKNCLKSFRTYIQHGKICLFCRVKHFINQIRNNYPLSEEKVFLKLMRRWL